jgi:hypothetical protein
MNDTLPPKDSKFWDSLALKHRSEHWPKRFGNSIPMLIRMNFTVRPDFPALLEESKYQGCVLTGGEVYHTTVNSHGAVCGICDNGQELGVKPDEFEVVEWYDPSANK